MLRQSEFEMNRRGMKLVPVVVVLAAIVVGVVAFLKSGIGPDGLYSHIDEYKAMLDNQTAANQSANATASGPAVVVNYNGSRIDDLMADLPKELQAENHSAVQTVVIISRDGTGFGGTAAGALAPVMNVQGMYTITAYLFDKQGGSIDAHNITKKSTITGAGAEAELRAQADPEMAEWIIEQLGG